jgi:hypothetical protein
MRLVLAGVDMETRTTADPAKPLDRDRRALAER